MSESDATFQGYKRKTSRKKNQNNIYQETTFELDDSFDDTNRRFVRRIQESEVRETLKRMKGGKAMGPDDIPIEV